MTFQHPFYLAQHADWQREQLLAAAERDRLARSATLPGLPMRSRLALALHTLAHWIDRRALASSPAEPAFVARRG